MLDFANHNTEVLEIRRCLFWPCYFSDKYGEQFLLQYVSHTIPLRRSVYIWAGCSRLQSCHFITLSCYVSMSHLSASMLLISPVDHLTKNEPWVSYNDNSSDTVRGANNN